MDDLLGLRITRWYSNRLNETTTLTKSEYLSNQNRIYKTVLSIRQNQTEFYKMKQFEYSSKPKTFHTINPFRYWLISNIISRKDAYD